MFIIRVGREPCTPHQGLTSSTYQRIAQRALNIVMLGRSLNEWFDVHVSKLPDLFLVQCWILEPDVANLN